MKISTRLTNVNGYDELYFVRRQNEGDVQLSQKLKGKFGQSEVSVQLLPSRVGDPHPDLIALTALLATEPFAASTIDIDTPVSAGFKRIFEENFQKRLLTPQPDIAPRIARMDSRDSLAFSGGVDSCAALALLPKDTVSLFLHRVRPSDQPHGLYRDEAALLSCDSVAKSGKEVYAVKTNIEYGRVPVGYPVDWSNAIPAVIHADALNLRSVSYGMVCESAFRTGSMQYSNIKDRALYRKWAPLFAHVGLPISLPTAGLSEVLTSRIAMKQAKPFHPQSCIRGTSNTPCMKCFKCFRKTILEAALTGRAVPNEHFLIFCDSKEVKKKLLERPIHHENVLAYSMHRIKRCGSPIYRAILEKTRPTNRIGLDFMDRHYTPSLDLVHTDHRDYVKSEISKSAKSMSEDDIKNLQAWDMSEAVSSKKYDLASKTLEELSKRKYDEIEERRWLFRYLSTIKERISSNA